MSQGTVVQVAGVTFHGTVADPWAFEGFALKELEGWTGTPSVRNQPVERPTEHGDFDDDNVTRGARLITMSGWCHARSAEKLRVLGERLGGVLADGRSGLLVIREHDETMRATVRLHGDARFARRGSSGFADWSLKLRAADPRKYGEVEDFPGGQIAINRGNFPARPQLIVSGTAAGGYTVTGPGGRRVVVTKALASGSPHTIDFAKGGLYINGVRQLRAISIYEPWDIPPGLPGVTATVNNGLSLIQRVAKTNI